MACKNISAVEIVSKKESVVSATVLLLNLVECLLMPLSQWLIVITIRKFSAKLASNFFHTSSVGIRNSQQTELS